MRNDRSKPHILFVGEKWCDCDPKRGISNAEHIFWGSLEASGLASFDKFHFDEYFLSHGVPGDEGLLRLCLKTRPDLIFFTWMHTYEDQWNPRLETLHIIRAELGIPIVMWWGDIHNPVQIKTAETLGPLIDRHIFPEPVEPFHPNPKRQDKYLTLPHPKDPKVFFDAGFARTIDVSFVGGVEGRPERLSGLEALKTAGINVYKSGGQREQNISLSEYAEIFQRSKITLNFCDYPIPIANGRCFEATMCGALMLDQQHSGAAYWLEAGIDYATYRDEKELVEKVHYYLSHEAEREAIARKGHEKAMRNHDGRIFWQRVLDQVANSAYDEKEDYLCVARARLQGGMLEAASNAIYHVLGIAEDHFEAHAVLGDAQFRQGNEGEAIKSYKRALELKPDCVEAALALTQIYLSRHDFKSALDTLKQARNSNCRDAKLSQLMGKILMERNRNEEALECLYDAIAISPDYAESYYYIWKILIDQGRSVEVGATLERAPTQITTILHGYLADIFEEGGKHDEAVQHRWMSFHPDAFMQRHKCHMHQAPFLATVLKFNGESDQAIKVLEDALRFSKNRMWKQKLEELEKQRV